MDKKSEELVHLAQRLLIGLVSGGTSANNLEEMRADVRRAFQYAALFESELERMLEQQRRKEESDG